MIAFSVRSLFFGGGRGHGRSGAGVMHPLGIKTNYEAPSGTVPDAQNSPTGTIYSQAGRMPLTFCRKTVKMAFNGNRPSRKHISVNARKNVCVVLIFEQGMKIS